MKHDEKIKRSIRLAFAAVAFCLASGQALMAQNGVFQSICTNAMLEGDYGFVVTGTRPSAPTPGPPPENIVGVAMTHFDGNGNLTQTDNIHGSITSTASPNRPGTGTYTINSDCSGIMMLSSSGSPTLTLSIVVVEDGNEVRTAVTDPTANVTPGTSQPQVIVTSNGRRVVTRQRGGAQAVDSRKAMTETRNPVYTPPDPCVAACK
jgi:hypothetical protein